MPLIWKVPVPYIIIIIIIYPLTMRSFGHHNFATRFLHFSLFSTALWDWVNSRPVHSLMLSSHLFFCLPCLLPPFTVPCKMVLAWPDEREKWPYHCSLHLFTMVRRSLHAPIACWILAQTSLLDMVSTHSEKPIMCSTPFSEVSPETTLGVTGARLIQEVVLVLTLFLG